MTTIDPADGRVMAIRHTRHLEPHLSLRGGWLRAAVLGANDGLLSTAALVVGVAAAGAGRTDVLIAGIAGLVAGALSMASGEYVSVSSQRDAEDADLAQERRELEDHPEAELAELIAIYESRGLQPALAREVAVELTRVDALSAHARDEIGLDEHRAAQPFLAAWTSALAFIAGAIAPVVAAIAPGPIRIPLVIAVTLLALAALGATGARLGGAPPRPAAMRVLLWGTLAMAISLAIGLAIGTAT